MTVLAVNENRDSPTGTTTFDGGPVYVREFTAYCSSVLDGPKTIIQSGAFPVVGQSWVYGAESEPLAICRTVSVNRQDEHGLWTDGTVCWIWDVRCEFRVEQTESNTPPNEPENPLLRPVKIRGGTQTYTENSIKDKDDKVVANSAKEAFPPHERLAPLAEFSFVRNESTSPAGYSIAYVGRLNASPIWDAAAKTILCTSITWDKQYENSYEFYQTTYSFSYKEDGWKLKLVDNGFNELVAGALKPILLPDNTKPTEPFKLNGSGAKAASNADPVIKEFDIYKTVNFASLGLPSTL